MPLTAVEARNLLKEVLDRLWATRRQPILGSPLKSALVTEALRRGSEFDEKALGYDGFATFLAQSGVAAVKFRGRNDVLVVPVEYAATLGQFEEASRRIRADFWQAFVGFPTPGEIRAYDRFRDAILVSPPSIIPEDAVRIAPISEQLQIEWRKKFVESLEEESPLRAVDLTLDSRSGLKAFARTLSLNPGLRERWNRFWVTQIAEFIRAWAREHGVPEHVWLLPTRDPSQSARREKLYAILDKIPLEKLLELQIPLRWLIEQNGLSDRQTEP